MRRSWRWKRRRLFPSGSLALLHSFEVPYRSLVSDNQMSRDFGVMEEETIRGFIEQAGTATNPAR